MNKIAALCLMCVVSLAAGGAMAADNWAQWRGPTFNGSTPETGLPASFAKDSATWAIDLPGRSGATPVIWKDHIFLPSANKVNKDLLAMCVSRTDGKVLWQNVVATGQDKERGSNTNMAGCSAVTDGERAIFLFGTGHLACFDFAGKELWKRDLAKDHGKFAIMWHYSSSPLLFDGKLYIPVLQRDRNTYSGNPDDAAKEIDSYLLCVDPKTGEDLWKHVRPSDAAGEAHESYCTPVPMTANGRTEIILIGGDYVTAHDPENGNEYWRFGSWNPTKINHVRLVPSVATHDGLVYAATPKHSFPFFAIKAGGSGDVTKTNLAWELDKGISPDVCTPCVYNNLLYILDGDSKSKRLYCVNPATGEKLWDGQLPGMKTYWASPIAADGKIFCINEDSDLSVVQAGPEGFKILETSALGDPKTYSSVAVAQKQLFVRTGTRLYCFGK
jgi:outer membrane protein assembly factor BamB